MPAKPTDRRHSITALTAVAATALVFGAFTPLPAAARPPPANGQIAFARFDATLGDLVAYTINPDGTHQQQLSARQ